MQSTTHLTIGLTPSAPRPKAGCAWINRVHGGPEALLHWLELRLGLHGLRVPRTEQITRFAGALETVNDAAFAKSLQADRWSTASHLLTERDRLRMEGWEDATADGLPGRAVDIHNADQDLSPPLVDTAVRLDRIREVLDAGQRLPEHCCALEDPIENWPKRWQPVLSRLTTKSAPETSAAAADDMALGRMQRMLASHEPVSIAPDASLRSLSTRSQTTACEFVAELLAQAPELLPETVVYCESDGAAIQLDACLHRRGLPTMGAATSSVTHPVLQVLPLHLAMCWEPVDPQLVLDLLTLRVGPIPRSVAWRLVESLSQQPGLGSAQWDKAVAKLCDPANDTEGKACACIESWLGGHRVPRGAPADSAEVAERCRRVAQWARGRSHRLAEAGDVRSTQLAEALAIAAGYAATLGELVQSQGASVSAPQLERLAEEVTAGGVPVTPLVVAAGGAVRVRSLAEIRDGYQRLIWLGVATADPPGCYWPVGELERYRSAGLDVDDGSRRLAALRAAETRGLAKIEQTLLTVTLPEDLKSRWHPIWLTAINALGDHREPVAVERLLADDATDSIAPWSFETAEHVMVAPQGLRPEWEIPAEFLRDREKASASELQARLGCPLQWVFRYAADLKPGATAKLPGDFQLKGTFCHGVLERLFEGRTDLPSADEAARRVGEIFDERLPLDAAPLAQPQLVLQRQRLRSQLINATRVLINALSDGGYRVSGIEMEIEGKAFEKNLIGWIDCVAENDGGREAVIDFKYAGRQKYRDLLGEGRAVQLATYAEARSQVKGADPVVAYLVLSDGLLFTPSGSELPGGDGRFVIDGPSIRSVWDRFAAAIESADAWLNSDAAVPARPLQPPEQWPADADLVLKENLRPDQCQEVCRYCDYARLCGLEELT